MDDFRTIFANRLLDAVAQSEVLNIAPHLRRVFLYRNDDVTFVEGERTFLYFPVEALLWARCDTTRTERPTSVLVVGSCGVSGLYNTLHVPLAEARTVVLSSGSAWRLDSIALENQAAANSALGRMLLRFAYASFAVSCCRLACNSEHNVDRRLARWLLRISDELRKPEISLTHHQLSEIAAIRRPSITVALSDLQRRGIVRVHHGHIEIIDRAQLQREACPCYEAIRKIVEGIFSPPTSEPPRFPISHMSVSGAFQP